MFGISDNGVSISLRGYDWLPAFLDQRVGMPIYKADANELASVFRATRDAAEYARKKRAPAMVVFEGISRRFGHAATDRQDAYLSAEEIEAAEAHNALASECARAVDAGMVDGGYAALADRFDDLERMVQQAFDTASGENKVMSRDVCVSFNSQPLVPKEDVVHAIANASPEKAVSTAKAKLGPKMVMRRAMTKVLDEALDTRPGCVYIGEDVQHGGYYRISDGLHKKFGFRVADFPPDETSLIGVGVGYSQAGLLPIVEIPYSKYLDCGADMFFEAIFMNWLSAGKRPNGMIIRLQGFDKGVFGGNFHTHNALHMPPGLDIVCYSNGFDYARGMRYCLAQAAKGRVIMTVDSTDLLNKRHVFDADDAWMTPFPTDICDVKDFDEVTQHGTGSNILIVSYGNGVPTALRAQKMLGDEHGVTGVVVADVPYLSGVPTGLTDILPSFDAVVFADVCKLGQHPHAGLVVQLQDRDLLPAKWRSVAAAPTYNPLGSTITFLNEQDIIRATLAVMGNR